MKTPIYIFWFSVIVWLIPPIRQYGRKYFYYFLVLALTDLTYAFLYYAYKIAPGGLYVAASIILIASLIGIDASLNNRQNIILLYAISILCSSIYILNQTEAAMFTMLIIIHLLITLLIIKDILASAAVTNHIDLFAGLLIIYEFSIILKFLFRLVEAKYSMLYFFLTNGFEILLGILFSCYQADNRLCVRLFKDNSN